MSRNCKYNRKSTCFGPILSRKKGRTFQHGSEEWDVYFELYENGYMPVVGRDFDIRIISLLLDEKDIAPTLKKLEDLGSIDDVSFSLFKDIVAGAASLSMKYG